MCVVGLWHKGAALRVYHYSEVGAGQFPAKWVSRQGGAYKRGGGQRIEAKAGGLDELGMVVTTCDVRITIKLHIREQRESCVDK